MSLEDRITELEKKYSDISDLYVQLEEENGDRCREIAELRQYTIDTQNRLDDAYNIINELKEQFKMFSGGEKEERRIEQMDPDCSDYDDPIPNSKPPEPKTKGGCYQWVYCSECMMSYDCPNPTKHKETPNYWKNARIIEPSENDPVGIVREIKDGEAIVEIIPATITDTEGNIWIHPKLLISKFVQFIKKQIDYQEYLMEFGENDDKIQKELKEEYKKWEERNK